MLIIDPDNVPSLRGSTRGQLPTDIRDALIYVVRPFVDDPPFFTPAHEMGHIFNASHGDGYELRDSNGQRVLQVCYSTLPTYRIGNNTLMEMFSGTVDGRVNYYSSRDETVQLYCPDESGYHTFNLGTSSQDVETEFIEANEQHVSNLYEDYGEAAARLAEVAPAPLDDAGIEGSTGVFSAENYPNPFNPQTTIRFTLQEDARVRLTVYDVLGREIMVLADGPHRVGTHEALFDGSRLPSGIYVYRLTATGEHGAHEATGRLTMLK